MAMRNGVMLQQKVKLLNQTDSLNMVKNVVRLGISIITYLRDLFDEPAYDDVVFQGMTLKMLKRVNAKSDILLNWLDKGIFDAIEKQYLQMLIFDINDIKDNTIECYKFTFNYNREDGTGDIDFAVKSMAKNVYGTNPKEATGRSEKNHMRIGEKEKNISNAQRLNDIKNRLLGVQGNTTQNNPIETVLPNNLLLQNGNAPGRNNEIVEKIKRRHREETAKKAKQLLETLVSLTADLGPLPEKTYLSMKLLYYDEYTPEEYQPELFREPQEQDLIAFQKKPDSLSVGDLGTDYHALSVSINTTCLPSRSWTIEELYEQLILTERKETIKKSLSFMQDLHINDLMIAENEHFINDVQQLTENERFRNDETHTKENPLHSQILKTATDIHEQTIHSTYTKQILDTYENISRNEIPEKTSALDIHRDNKLKNESPVSRKTEADTQKEQIHKKNKIENEQNSNGNEPQEAQISQNTNLTEGKYTPPDSVENQAKYESNKTKNMSTLMGQENKQIDEEQMKRYILSNKVISKQQLKKIYRHVSSATLSKILNELIKEGTLRQYKHSVYRLCSHVTKTKTNQNKKEKIVHNKGTRKDKGAKLGNKKDEDTQESTNKKEDKKDEDTQESTNKEEDKKESYKKMKSVKDSRKNDRKIKGKELKGKTEGNKKKKGNEVKRKIEEGKEKHTTKEMLASEHIVKNNTELVRPNNKNDAKHILLEDCKQTTSNDASQNTLQLTQNNPLSSTIQEHRDDSQPVLDPSFSSNERKTQHLNIGTTAFEAHAKSIHLQNIGENSPYKKTQGGYRGTNAQHTLSDMINEKMDSNINAPKGSNDSLNSNSNTNSKKKKKNKKNKKKRNKKNEVKQNRGTCANVRLPKANAKEAKKVEKMGKKQIDKTKETNDKIARNEKKERSEQNEKNGKQKTSEGREGNERNETSERYEKLEIYNSSASNNHLAYTGKSGDDDFSKAFNEIEKLYNDVCQSCKSTKYINKEIMSKGLGIEPRLTKPLLERLMKDGYVSKKVIKNKGYESFLYEPLHITYKRKFQETNISNDENICLLNKKIHT